MPKLQQVELLQRKPQLRLLQKRHQLQPLRPQKLILQLHQRLPHRLLLRPPHL